MICWLDIFLLPFDGVVPLVILQNLRIPTFRMESIAKGWVGEAWVSKLNVWHAKQLGK